ncbi:MAG: 4-hydroxythreonine-4-phosphate dehydrogenase PdxA [Paludibacteraceae bacterium]|nr:4-hydroxythreonine-4-phosphate dehydrogenase PdxA [Paludibacteraceae bacterium]
MEKERIKIGITQGDINGIGYEVIIKSLSDNQILEQCTPIIYGSPKAAAYHRKLMDIQSFNLNVISNISEAHSKKVNIINCSDDEIKVEIAKSSPEAGVAALAALEMATDDLNKGLIDALVTAPINRKSMSSDKSMFLGHTEFLEELLHKKGEALMMMLNDSLKIALLTGHTSLSSVSGLITKELIVKKVKTLNNILIQDFGVHKPRIAVLSLNPHAGEDGLLGDEETRVIIPAIKELNDSHYLCVGPLAADSFFGSSHFTKYDAVLAMYHDQGMIPFKAISMNMGVNYTANLPIIRTAPIHGTEYEIAGQNLASEESFRNALYMACDIYHHRKQHKEITANPLKKQEVEKSGIVE